MYPIKKHIVIVSQTILILLMIFLCGCNESNPSNAEQTDNSDKIPNIKTETPLIVQPIMLSSSLLSGKWAYMTYDYDGCNSLAPQDNQIFNFSILPSSNGQFSSTWGKYNVTGAIANDTALIMVATYNDYLFNTKTIRIVAAFQTAPNSALSGSVFSGFGFVAQLNATTGYVNCEGSYSFIMVRDFSKIGGSSSSSGSTYNPTSKSSPSIFKSDCYQEWLTCNKACSWDYMNTQPSSICFGRCDLEKAKCNAR